MYELANKYNLKISEVTATYSSSNSDELWTVHIEHDVSTLNIQERLDAMVADMKYSEGTDFTLNSIESVVASVPVNLIATIQAENSVNIVDFSPIYYQYLVSVHSQVNGIELNDVHVDYNLLVDLQASNTEPTSVSLLSPPLTFYKTDTVIVLMLFLFSSISSVLILSNKKRSLN